MNQNSSQNGLMTSGTPTQRKPLGVFDLNVSNLYSTPATVSSSSIRIPEPPCMKPTIPLKVVQMEGLGFIEESKIAGRHVIHPNEVLRPMPSDLDRPHTRKRLQPRLQYPCRPAVEESFLSPRCARIFLGANRSHAFPSGIIVPNDGQTAPSD